jgi:hypothetical protein
MIHRSSIKNILKEETKRQEKLSELVKRIGIVNASNVVGGFDKLANLLQLELEDIDTQEMLVKNYIYFASIEDIEVNFIEVKNRANRKLIKIYFGTDSNARNIKSWYAMTIRDEMNDFFPFKVDVSWHPVNYPKAKIMIDAEIGGVVDFPDEINESVYIRRRFSKRDFDDAIQFGLKYTLKGLKQRTSTWYRMGLENFIERTISIAIQELHDEVQTNEGNWTNNENEIWEFLNDLYIDKLTEIYRKNLNS